MDPGDYPSPLSRRSFRSNRATQMRSDSEYSTMPFTGKKSPHSSSISKPFRKTTWERLRDCVVPQRVQSHSSFMIAVIEVYVDPNYFHRASMSPIGIFRQLTKIPGAIYKVLNAYSSSRCTGHTGRVPPVRRNSRGRAPSVVASDCGSTSLRPYRTMGDDGRRRHLRYRNSLPPNGSSIPNACFAQDDIEGRNAAHAAKGKPSGLYIFQEGAFLSAIRLSDQKFVTLTKDYTVEDSFGCLDDWYIRTLRAEFGERYGLAPLGT